MRISIKYIVEKLEKRNYFYNFTTFYLFIITIKIINIFYFFFLADLPPPQMLQAAKDLIAFGVAKGYIHPEFKLLGHRQVRDTECPGGRLFQEISTWPHFSPKPNTTENEISKQHN